MNRIECFHNGCHLINHLLEAGFAEQLMFLLLEVFTERAEFMGVTILRRAGNNTVASRASCAHTCEGTGEESDEPDRVL